MSTYCHERRAHKETLLSIMYLYIRLLIRSTQGKHWLAFLLPSRVTPTLTIGHCVAFMQYLVYTNSPILASNGHRRYGH